MTAYLLKAFLPRPAKQLHWVSSHMYSDVPAGPGDHPPFPAICTPEWANKANKIKGTGQATLTTKIERLTTVKVTDVWISGDEK